MGKTAIIFDWDGTLFDSMRYKKNNFIELFSRFSNDREKLAALHEKLSGIPRQELFSRIYLEVVGKPLNEQIFQELSAAYTKANLAASKNSSLFPDAYEVIESLKKLKLFVSSSSAHDELMEVVTQNQVAAFFAGVFGSKPGFGKGRGHFDHIMKTYKLNKNQAIFVGDDEQDMRLAEDFGIEAVRIIRGSPTSSGISLLTELPRLIID